MGEQVILFGAGAAGSYALKYLRSQGIEPVAFADNDAAKWGEELGRIGITSPHYIVGIYPEATWVACAISRPAATELRRMLKEMGVKTKPLWECLPVCHGLPTVDVMAEMLRLVSDVESHKQVIDQYDFRKRPDYETQRAPSPISELYFPDFITRRDDEGFVDCGAADGDTVREFINRWPKFASIVAFEPDRGNYNELLNVSDPESKGRITSLRMAVSDFDGDTEFEANGDYSSHLGKGLEKVRVTTLDKMIRNMVPVPSYIKADVEGSELELLWGARIILRNFMPVLAICAYHTSDHFWEIPLLIHAIQPNYKLFFRRYGEGAYEIVWYAVPPERVKL